MSKCAVITGIAGQDGSYLAELLLEKGYFVFGFVRRTASDTCRERIKHLEVDPRVRLMYGDLTDISSIHTIINAAVEYYFKDNDESYAETVGTFNYIEVYNLAAQSHVKISFETPVYTANSDAIGVLNMLETIRQLPAPVRDRVRFYQASTSEMFGSSPSPQNINTPFHPRSPYGVSKLYAHWITINYRESYGLWACSGILFNHESERRAKNFVTRKVTCAAAQYWASKKNKEHESSYVPLRLGNLDAKRDWGYSPDYVNGMWLILQQDVPKEYVLSTGKSHTVRELCEAAFDAVNVKLEWKGEGEHEKGYNASTGELVVEVHPKYYRPAEVDDLRGDSIPAVMELGWRPKVRFLEMILRMVENDKNEIVQKQNRSQSGSRSLQLYRASVWSLGSMLLITKIMSLLQ